MHNGKELRVSAGSQTYDFCYDPESGEVTIVFLVAVTAADCGDDEFPVSLYVEAKEVPDAAWAAFYAQTGIKPSLTLEPATAAPAGWDHL